MQFDFTTLNLLGPEGRANAIKSTLTQIAALPGAAQVALKDLAAAFLLLGAGGQSGMDTPQVQARRATCREIAHALDAAGYGLIGGAAGGALPWFQAQIDAWGTSEDPRQKAMADTARREIVELRPSPSPIDAVLAAHPGPHTDCSFDGGGRYPRNDEGWDARPCAYLFLGRHRVNFDQPRPRGEVVAEAEASGRVFFNDTPQVTGRLAEPVTGPEWKSRVFAARLPSGEPHALAWWWDGVTHTAVPHDQVVWG